MRKETQKGYLPVLNKNLLLTDLNYSNPKGNRDGWSSPTLPFCFFNFIHIFERESEREHGEGQKDRERQTPH